MEIESISGFMVWRERVLIFVNLAAGIVTLSVNSLQMKFWDVVVGIGSVFVLPILFDVHFFVGFLTYICLWKYVGKVYHALMSLCVFIWLLGSVSLNLRVSQLNVTDLQYLKKMHHYILEKLSHHLLQLSAKNKNQSVNSSAID